MTIEAHTPEDDRADAYPSRGQQRSGLRERVDPVVYAPSLDGAPIEPTLVERYAAQGYLVLDNLFSTAEIERFQGELQRLRCDRTLRTSPHCITEPGSDEVRSIFRVHRDSPVFRRLVADPRLVGLARYLLNDEVYIHQSRVNYKPGFRGKEFYWHSDFETWHVEDGLPRMRALSMSLILTDNYDYNGPLMVIPGSHRHYVVCEGETPDHHFDASLRRQEFGTPSDACLQQLVIEGGIQPLVGKAGSLVVFDCNLMHGSNGNITPYPRSNAFFVYNALGNRIEAPFCDQPPRPEFLASREPFEPVLSAP